MRKKTKTWNKIKEPFKELGIELKGSSGMYEFEYNKAQMFLFVIEEDESISFAAYVAGVEKEEDKVILEMALDIVSDFHKGYCAEWNEGVAFFASDCYCLKGKRQPPKEWLSAELKKFWDAYMFLEANIFLLSGNNGL